jgi:hypothetical protein
MATKGTNLTAEIELEISRVSKGKVIPYRTNAGDFWGGKFMKREVRGKHTYTVLEDANRVKGLPPGFADLLIIIPTIITPDMVGTKFARVGFIEVKAPGDTVKPIQINFQKQMDNAGAVTCIAWCVEDAIRIIGGAK